MAAIRNAELGTSGEIRVHFSKKIVNDVLTDAQAVFKQLKMDATERHNGVLIYIVPSEKQFAIIGDLPSRNIFGDNLNIFNRKDHLLTIDLNSVVPVILKSNYLF